MTRNVSTIAECGSDSGEKRRLEAGATGIALAPKRIDGCDRGDS